MVRLSLCNQSSFCAENELVTVTPYFNFEQPVPLLSCPNQSSIGPFQADLATTVPLWIAKTLYQRKLARIELPEWLATERILVEILKEEIESVLLTNKLPFYYYEIARSLDFCLPKQTQMVLQDVVAVRSDKLRQHFHALSRTDLQEHPFMDDDDDETSHELPMISVTGIASYELNKVGPFLQRAFSDYGFLTKRAVDDGFDKAASGGVKGRNSATSSRDNAKDDTLLDKDKTTMDQEHKKVSMARSRLRRFRSEPKS